MKDKEFSVSNNSCSEPPERISRIDLYVGQYKWKEKTYRIKTGKRFETNKKKNVLNVLFL